MLSAGAAAPSFSAKPIFGRTISVPESLDSGPLVLFFVRSLASSFGRQSLAEIQERYADFDREGIRVVAISPSSWEVATDFVPRRQLLFPLVADSDGELAKRYQLSSDRWMLRSVSGLLAGGYQRAWKAVQQGHGLMKLNHLPRLGGEFVIDRSGTLAYAQYAASALDGPDLDVVLECACAC